MASYQLLQDDGVVGQSLARDVAQRLVDPAVSLRVQRGVVRVFQQLRNHAAALFLGEHAGLRQAAGRALSHHRRSVVVKRLQQRRNRLVGSQVSQAFDCPVADFRIGVLQLADQYLVHALRLDPAVAEQDPVPKAPKPFASCGPFSACCAKRSTVAGDLIAPMAARSNSIPAARTRRSLELSAVVISELNWGVNFSFPHQPSTRVAI